MRELPLAGEFKKAFKDIDQAIKQGTTRALNRALSSAKTQLVKNIGQDTGLKASLIKERVLDIKANSKKQNVQLAIAIKVGVSLSEFSPSTKKVEVVHTGHTKATTHYGVSVKAAGGRQLVPGGFLWNASGKKLVLGRSDPSNNTSTLATLRSNAFKDSATARRDETQRFLEKQFEDAIVDQLEYAIKSKLDSNR